MDVENDAILKDTNNSYWADQRARSEERILDQIYDADITSRDRCEAGFMLIDGKSPSDVYRFIEAKEPTQRP